LFFCLFNLTAYIDLQNVSESSISINTAYASNVVLDGLETALKSVLHVFSGAVAWFVTFGLEASATIIDPALFDGIFTGMDSGLYDIWTFIRDIFNVFFIFVLLFSAFATIFQVQKYHLLKSNILTMIIIMALLVNFSWPITRVIIDAGNVTMYYFLDNFVDSDSSKPRALFGMFGDKSNVMLQLNPPADSDTYKNQSVVDAFFSLLILFAFACAFIVFAILFLIRISAFILLLIFSPIGFAAAIFPGTQKFADMWWESLFKWTFTGPILLFMVFISIKFLTVMDAALKDAYVHGVAAQGFVRNAILYGVALAMISVGITASQKMSGSAAQTTINGAKSIGRRIGRKTLVVTGGAAIIAGKTLDSKIGSPIARMDGYFRGKKKAWVDNESKSQEKWRDAKENASADIREAKGEDNAIKKHKNASVLANRKRTKNQNSSDLQSIINDTSETESYRQAAREELASRKDSIKTAKDLTANLKLMGDSFSDNIELINNAAKDDAFEGTSSDFKDLMSAIDAKVNMSTSDKNRLKSKVHERYLEEGSAKSVYEYNKAHVSSTHKKALQRTFANSTIKEVSEQESLINEIPTDTAVKDFFKELAINQRNKNEMLKNASIQSRIVFRNEDIV